MYTLHPSRITDPDLPTVQDFKTVNITMESLSKLGRQGIDNFHKVKQTGKDIATKYYNSAPFVNKSSHELRKYLSLRKKKFDNDIQNNDGINDNDKKNLYNLKKNA